MTVYHAKNGPDLLTCLGQMLGSSAGTNIAVGYFFVRLRRIDGRNFAVQQDPHLSETS